MRWLFWWPFIMYWWFPFFPYSREQELQFLEWRKKMLEEELKWIEKRIEELKKGG